MSIDNEVSYGKLAIIECGKANCKTTFDLWRDGRIPKVAIVPVPAYRYLDKTKKIELCDVTNSERPEKAEYIINLDDKFDGAEIIFYPDNDNDIVSHAKGVVKTHVTEGMCELAMSDNNILEKLGRVAGEIDTTTLIVANYLSKAILGGYIWEKPEEKLYGTWGAGVLAMRNLITRAEVNILKDNAHEPEYGIYELVYKATQSTVLR